MLRTSPKLDSTYGMIEVKKGRKRLAARMDKLNAAPIPVLIVGCITRQYSNDDGISIGFVIDVEHAMLLEVK